MTIIEAHPEGVSGRELSEVTVFLGVPLKQDLKALAFSSGRTIPLYTDHDEDMDDSGENLFKHKYLPF
ncbi:hypothetical protein [Candidatus Desulfosporosinus nitrosoreducens]|uniref:hypothetical protein n=1 Tax=Candidatus Desulfosporosinus nitrosoreducens TaxID=3401928 RepID=UPI00280B81A6|nr:hypothetical protein [Desulfosporosinus sp. PR]